MKLFKNNNKCSFCSSLDKTSSKNNKFCHECLKIRDYIRLHGLSNILTFIQVKPASNLPPY